MNLNEEILRRIINDPSLMKELEKLAASAPALKKEKKFKELGHPAYVNEVACKCKLCSSTWLVYICMSWDKEEKLYRASARHLDNVWKDLPIYKMTQRRSSCRDCSTVLMQKSKEDLISLLIASSESNLITHNHNGGR